MHTDGTLDNESIVAKKPHAIDEDHAQLARALLEKVSQLQQQVRGNDEMGSTPREEIEQAKLEYCDLAQIKASLDHAYDNLLKKKAAEIQGLTDAMSPLLSLERGTLASVVSYLDEEALLAFEGATNENHQDLAMKQWTFLDEIRPQVGKSNSDAGPRERGVRYAKAASFARRMEKAAEKHYNTDSVCKDWPDELYTLEDHQNACFYVDHGNWDSEFFVRLSSHGGRSSTWEGFLRADHTDFRIKALRLSMGEEPYRSMNWTEADRFWENLRNENRYEQWPESLQKLYLENLKLTTVVYCGDLQIPVKLIVSTSGYFASRHTFAMLRPRSPVAHKKSVDLDDCVMAALEVNSVEFDLVIEWGAYKDF